MTEKLMTCNKHLQLYSHYCKAVGCKKLLCNKCIGPHKVFHQSGTSIVTILSMYNTLLSDMEISHDRFNDLLTIVKGLGEEFKIYESQLNNDAEKIEELMVKIYNYGNEKKNSKIGDCYARFLRIKIKQSKTIMKLIAKIIFHDKVGKAFQSLYENTPIEIPIADVRDSLFHFINPILKTEKTLSISSVIASSISSNIQITLFNNSIFVINGDHRELFESTVKNIMDPKEVLKFVPRADLLKKIKSNTYSIIRFHTTYLYTISSEGFNQKYSYYTDKWLPVPPLRMKNANLNVSLISDHYLYAFSKKNTGVYIETLDLLDEDSGWHLILPKLKEKINLSSFDSSIIFQQTNDGIMILGNISNYTIRDSKTVTSLYYNKTDNTLNYSTINIPEIKFNKSYYLYNKRYEIYFIEEDYSARTAWKFNSLEKSFNTIYKIDI